MSGKKERDPRELSEDLLEQADETRRLIARFSEDSDAWRTKALLAALKNDNVILEALAALVVRKPAAQAAAAAPPSSAATTPPRPMVLVEELTPEPSSPETSRSASTTSATTTSATTAASTETEPCVDGARARAIVEEFDNRDHTFERGLDKLNSWIAGGKGALPFQKRETHAYLNRSASSEAMIARVESELMGREGFTRRLGKLKVDGLVGDILVYERG